MKSLEKRAHDFEKRLGFSFNNPDVLLKAFVHRSYVNENRDFTLGHNERLEFLGDAVLELVVTEALFHTYPKKSEGELTAVRAALVNTRSLSEAAAMLNMQDFLLLSRGEARGSERARSYILANSVEAVIGAIYVDQGYERAKDFIQKTLLSKADEVVKNKLWIDSKSFFQEKAQEKHSITPTYELLEESGPDHDKHFRMGVFIGKKQIAEGKGASKQEAESDAARRALEQLGWI